MKFSKTSLILLVIQLAIISSIAAKYFYQRVTCPRVWTRAAAYDPALFMRGRYLSLRLTVDACASTLPSAKQAQFPRNIDGVPNGNNFSIQTPQDVYFSANLAVKNNKLTAIRIADPSIPEQSGQTVVGSPRAACDAMRLAVPVDFYIPEHAADPSWVKPGQEMWIEVTVPPKGPPRPLQLALKDSGAWKPLAFQ
jgi:hypothetical protein